MKDDVKKRKEAFKREKEQQKDVEWIGSAKEGVAALEPTKVEANPF